MSLNFKTSLTSWLLSALLLGGILMFFFIIKGKLSSKIDYNTQVKPILNKRCIQCHGGVKKSGEFSLMTKAHALQKNESGKPAIIPGDPDNSEMMRRILSDDTDLRMPLEEEPLPQEEIDILKQWINEGAEWGKHWAYVPVNKNKTAINNKTTFGIFDSPKWGNNAIDIRILEKLEGKGLSPSPRAKKEKLLRRASFDLIGLPPPTSLKEQFLREESPISYQAVLDTLLASPHFGERWASMWLDLARYADSKGFERDQSRTIWQYRDYLIRAFNQDLPYDQFIIEQLAGDLLPNPSDAQYIATGFHRNTPTNDEGGTDNEEYRVAATLDRVNTTWEALMGTTFACVQCHGHPYDPFYQKEYYEFLAFFNNTRDNDTYADYPWLRQLSSVDAAKLTDLTQWVAAIETPERAADIRKFVKTLQPSIYSLETDQFVNSDLYDTKYLGFRKDGSARLQNVNLTDKKSLFIRAFTTKKKGVFSICLDSLNGEKIVEYSLPYTRRKYEYFEIPLKTVTGKHDLFFKYENKELSDPNAQCFNIDWLAFFDAFPGQGDKDFKAKKAAFKELIAAKAPHTLIMMENPNDWERETYIFDRGNWLSPLEKVEPTVPKLLATMPENMPKNRLGLAKWIANEQNPLTGRTMVNRIWEQIFGTGIAETVEDLGTQGIPPTHPELLEELTATFMYEYSWSLKKLLRLILSSETYCQTAQTNPQLQAADPYNKLYSRGPRIRLNAEQIRDQALVVSALWNAEMFGPPVMPYQPADLWQSPYNSEKWEMEDDKNRYRRAIYTFVKRSAPYPSMETFDVSPRQVCVARRIRTNTPLQALVTLNDPVFVEAAQHFALRMQEKGGEMIENQIKKGYLLAIGQEITKEKQIILENLYEDALKDFEKEETAAQEILGNLKVESNINATAAMVVVANAIMNLDEFLTK